ncbi:MAG: yhjX [Chloroflexi bacterium]|jgi:sugar phosphate permease|nr:yhjX [Chloroflexota bacterium]
MVQKVPQRAFHYAWIVAGITALTLIVSAGVRSTPSVLIVPLQNEFGWTRADISLAVSINLILFGLFGPFAAALMERYGMRRVMLIALTTVGIAAAMTSQMTAPWHLDLLWGVVIGTGTGATAIVLSATVANRWFIKRRGLVVGLLSASSATGQLIFLPLLAWLVTSFGWQAASWTTSIAVLAIVPIVALGMRNRPADIGLKPYGATGETVITPPATGNPIAAALGGLGKGLRSRNFWILSGSFFVCGASTNGLIGTHLIPAAMDHGFAEVAAAGLVALIGIFDVIGTTISGWLSDRFDNRKLLTWYYGLRGLSLLFLPYALNSTFAGLLIFIVFYGLDWVATVPPTVRLTSDIFGKASGGIMFGWIFAAHQFGAATAAFGAGALYTWLGDYSASFWTAGLLCLVAAGMVTRIKQPGKETGIEAPQAVPEIRSTEPAPL